MATVGFLGLGAMGLPMARNLLGAGHRLTVYNRTSARARPLLEAGAHWAATPAQAAQDADLVIAIVGDDAASKSVWLGPEGALSVAPKPGAIAVESSTLSQAWVKELATLAQRRGWRYLDGPVTGGPDGAAERRLTLLAGGESETIAAAQTVLSAYIARILHFGPIGTGTAYKLVANLMGAAQLAALAEGMRLAAKAGLDLDLAAQALSSGALASPLVKTMVGRMAQGRHDDVYFATRWRAKDAAYGLALAKALGQPMPVSAAALALFERAIIKGLAEVNESAVIDAL
ncbi:MAG: NAD(P)-dependent oxidoreductase [Rhodospirillales bacterium]|nr:NAD(P)-dependent oxidoreductase [Rhodospirillales bacterium]